MIGRLSKILIKEFRVIRVNNGGKNTMVENFIKDALENDYIVSIGIEKFSSEQLKELAEKAKKFNILVSLRAEYNNAYQGILVCLIRKDIMNDTFLNFV